jgi:hypothetical protein
MEGHTDEFGTYWEFRGWGETRFEAFTSDDDFLHAVRVEHEFNTGFTLRDGNGSLLRGS